MSCVVMVLSWIGQAEFSQNMQSKRQKKFNHPLFITWTNHSCLCLFFLFSAAKVVFFGGTTKSGALTYSIREYLAAFNLSMKRYALLALMLGFLYFIPNYLWFVCLGMPNAPVEIVTAVFNTSVASAYVFAVVFLKERLVCGKVLAVVVSICGAFLTSLANGGSKFDAGSFINPAALLTFFAAVLYGLWEVLYKKYGVKDSTPPLLLCFILGSYGLAHLFVFWVFFIPFNYFGWEPFRFPSTGQFQLIAFNAFLGTMYNVSFMAALALLPSPVFVSVAGLMTIPLSALSDYLLHGTTLGALQITGVALIVFGFGMFLKYDYWDATSEDEGPEYAIMPNGKEEEETNNAWE
jgi:drug/metabolite transporter (DMT)-like permease